jgi:hypothetical protein
MRLASFSSTCRGGNAALRLDTNQNLDSVADQLCDLRKVPKSL